MLLSIIFNDDSNSKSQDKTIFSCSHNNNHRTKINKDKDDDTQLEKEDSSNKVVIIGK